MNDIVNFAVHFCQMTGTDIHTWQTRGTDGKMHQHSRPDFSDAREVMKAMDALPSDKGKLFFAKLIYRGDDVEAIDDDGYIERNYVIDTTGLLLKKAVAFLKEEK